MAIATEQVGRDRQASKKGESNLFFWLFEITNFLNKAGVITHLFLPLSCGLS